MKVETMIQTESEDLLFFGNQQDHAAYFQIFEKFIVCSDFIGVTRDQHHMVFKITDHQKH